ncbi:peptidase U32 family protein [Sporolituus thermophilus]|uniref:Putative protease n=1 Tax=Sporolituus thermophilus DSM 23256 TaxID=1123285 RepID=A0A1G7ICU8_9FIRM|nr:U32 family peptidase [Sporolituus thermophilus]SDF10475.1 putative protease [Sporolituus thermophilus DSM 23256]
MKKPELLAPAGNLEKLKIAILYGADAVYFGGKSFGLRAFSDNFSEAELKEAVAFVHQAGKKGYVTINVFPHNEDLPALPEYIRYLRDIGVDGIIISDLGVYRIARQVAPDLPLHISTQANNTNWSAVLCWQELGARRVVLAREISLEDIRVIRQKVNIELEAFVHGAMCISYSGRCLLSNYFTGRDANRGECTQACRWKYYVMEETRPGQFFPVLEDERGTYIFNSKDLCLLPHIPALAASGLDSFKIEGRMKSVHYVATVVKVYRQAINSYFADPDHYEVRPEWWEELQKISHRPYTTGFYFNKTTQEDQIYSGATYKQTYDFIGLVRSYNPVTGMALVEQRNNMKVGEEIEIFQPSGPTFRQRITAMFDSEGNAIDVAPHPQQLVTMPVNQPVAEYAMLRRQVKAHG